jgi:hypothetical protein
MSMTRATVPGLVTWLFLVVSSLASPDRAQADEAEVALRNPAGRPVLSAGLSALLLQSYMFNHAGLAFDASVDGVLGHGWSWSLGGRLGFGPPRPEGFARLSATPTLGRWMATAGLELGVTARTRYDAGLAGVAQALRAQAEEEASPIYLALHAATLRFRLQERWRVSLLEVHIGTHLGRAGEHVRVQVGLFQIGRAL